jgi:hypothetical protein
MSDKKADAIRRAEELNDRFSYITPKTDVPTPEQYFGLPKSPARAKIAEGDAP